MKKSAIFGLFVIFFTAFILRVLFFPQNVYFGFDQARDAFESLDIYKNFNFKIIGPSTAAENLFHGPLYWYLIGPFYWLSGGNPEIPAAFLLFLNALGVFSIFWIGKTLFNPVAGMLAGFLYAVSFEQTQYALYFGNPAPAVLTVMTFYAGLAFLVFKKNWIGLPVSLFALGLSIQFEFFLIYLSFIFVIIVVIFKKEVIPQITIPRILVSLFSFSIAVSTFVLAEIKFGFRTVTTLIETVASIGRHQQEASPLLAYWDKLTLHVHDNLVTGNKTIQVLILSVLLLYFFYLILNKKNSYKQITFLIIWFLSSAFLFLFGIPKLYYSNIGIAPALLLLVAYIISKIYVSKKPIAIFFMIVILVSNLVLISKRNSEGVISDIYVQEGMLLSREKQALDFIYQQANKKPIVVSALTMPLKINTTWAYLFNWYGKNKYGYLPYWAGEVAPGFPGFLPSWKSQEEEYIMFSIIEPTRGVRYAFVEQYLSEQEQYGKVVEEKVFGDKSSWLIVQLREEHPRKYKK